MKLQGLTAAQVEDRIRKGQVNARSDTGTKTVGQIIKSNIFTYFNLVFIILGILLIIAGSFNDLSFLLVIAGNSAIGIFQEIQSKKVLDKMNLMTQPKVTVIRDYKEESIRTENLVKGDYFYLFGGTQIPADSTVLGGSIHVNESILTGESDEIEKKRGDRLLAGSVIVSGTCIARADEVGDNTYAAKLTKEATMMESKEESEILASLNKMLKFFGILIIPLGIILFFEQYRYSQLGFSDSISGTVAALIGMIPEGIYLLTSVALAVSAMRLAQNKVLVHDLKCIETLSRVDVLCVDKTGTITDNEMDVVGIVPLQNGEGDKTRIRTALADYAINVTDVNDTMQALKKHFTKGSGKKAQAACPFSSKYKYSAQTIGGCHYVLGAPEYVLGVHAVEYKDKITSYNAKGYRVMAFAQYPTLPNGEMLHENKELEPLALVVLENPVREEAPETFKYFTKQGVTVKVISGDNPLTVARVAQKAGIAGAERYVDVSAISSPQELQAAANQYTVFGRVTPECKKLLVAAMQKEGHKVAMTGDGVNDIIAMKQADCSVAMASGAEAASQASQLVLLDSDFSHMPDVVNEGRRVVNNIERAATLYLVKNIFSLLLAVFSVILMFNYPLNPSQITLISIFTIGIPSFVLALEPNHDRIRGHFLRNVVLKALPAGITDFLVVSGMILFCNEFNVDSDSMSTACSVIVAIVGFMILLRIMERPEKSNILMIIGSIAGYIVCLFAFGSFFGISSVSRKCAFLLLIFAIITEPILRYLTAGFEWAIKKIKERKQQREEPKEQQA